MTTRRQCHSCGARRNGEQPCCSQNTQCAKQANVVGSVLDARLRKDKCDPKGYHEQGIGARPAMDGGGKVGGGG